MYLLLPGRQNSTLRLARYLSAARSSTRSNSPQIGYYSNAGSVSLSRRNAANASSASSATIKPYYITTPIFYPNASPHIGHLYTLVAGDVFARYERLKRGLPPSTLTSADNQQEIQRRNEDVRLLTGTDEHGMKIQKAAAKFFGESGREKEFCDALSGRFSNLGKKANISNTCFMRTTSEAHRRAVEDVWRRIQSKGYIYKGNYSGWYSITDECFYTDAQVARVATASSTGLSSTTTATFASNVASDVGPGAFQTIAIETGSPVEWSEEENYMFRLSAFREELLAYYEQHEKSVYPPQYRDNVLNILRGAGGEVADISISRPSKRLSWGIGVPDDETQTVYVWFDALLIYLTGSGYPWSSSAISDGETGCWPADLQVIGKDILKFHAVYLPAILRALSAPSYSSGNGTSRSGGVDPSFMDTSPSALSSSAPSIPLAKTILAHAHWTSEQKKMSKSLGNVADPLEAMEKWGVDIVRYYLMRIGGRWRDDVDWSSSQLDKHQKEIHAQLGNYFMRITSPKLYERVAPAIAAGDITLERCISHELVALFDGNGMGGGVVADPNYALMKATLELPGKFHTHMETFEAGLAVGEILTVLKLANKTLTDIAPWSSTTSPSLIHATQIVALETLRVVAGCLEPFMPTVGQKLTGTLVADGDDGVLDSRKTASPPVGNVNLRAFWERWTGREIKGFRLF